MHSFMGCDKARVVVDVRNRLFNTPAERARDAHDRSIDRCDARGDGDDATVDGADAATREG